MEKLYDRQYWHNNATPALNESNLNSLSKAVDEIDDRVVELADDVMVIVPQIQHYLDQAEDLVEALETLSQNPPYIGSNGNWFVWDTNTEAFVDSGIDASITVTIADVTAIEPDATPYVTNTGTNTDPIFHLFIPRGQKGDNGVSVTGVTLLSTSGKVKTYRMTFSDGTHFDFNVTDGEDGQGSGDMLKSEYDPDDDVANAGGIVDYVAGAISGKADSADVTAIQNVIPSGASASNQLATANDLDNWTASATVASDGTVTFSGLDDTHGWGYKPYCVVNGSSTNLNPSAELTTITGAGTSNMSLTYETDADSGATVYLRILK